MFLKHQNAGILRHMSEMNLHEKIYVNSNERDLFAQTIWSPLCCDPAVEWIGFADQFAVILGGPEL